MRSGTLARVFLRGLWLQASWNRRGMQGLGFAWAIWPALREIHSGEEEREEAALRHLSLFNCHPYAASGILGGAVHYEERIARGEATPGDVSDFKGALMGPMSALGDSFFWMALRPFASAVSVFLVPWLGFWSVLLFVALAGLPPLLLRILLFREGYLLGGGMIAAVERLRLPRRGQGLRWLTAVVGAGVAAGEVGAGGGLGGAGPGLGVALAIVAGAVGVFLSWRLGPVGTGIAAVAAGSILAMGAALL